MLKKLRGKNLITVPLCCRHKCFPVCPRAQHLNVADTNFVSGTQEMFLILFRNILCPQQMFPSLHSPRNIMSNNVSPTMCPRLPGPLRSQMTHKFHPFCWRLGSGTVSPLESWEVKLCRHVRSFSFCCGHFGISSSEVTATKKLPKWVDCTHQGKDAK